ncbi:DUF4352 domain-containing protein [Intrasporangium sp. DVR]|uniref:DUF4352 domain-containing protein n=1 Tax=Intrasporangium sp. DVR TaxID=3127867 RepID=UPI00313A5E2A
MTTNWQPPTIPAPPAPPKPSWFARHKVLTTFLALVVILVLAEAFGGAGDPAPVAGSAGREASAEAPGRTTEAETDEETRTQTGEESEEETEEVAATIGTAVRDGKFEFTVTKVRTGIKSVGSDMFGEKAQGQFVLVHVTVTNVGDESQYFSDSSQTVRDAKGREFSADTGAAIHLDDNEVFLNDINPGNTVKGVLVYDMPKGAKPASIELHDSPFSGGVTVRLG